MIYFSNKFQDTIIKWFPIVFILLGAALPVTAASWSQKQKITSTPRGVGAQFGNAVAINGNTMVVGAQFDSTTASQAGAAFVFVLNGTTWTQQAKLLASDGAVADKFGYSVAISENTIVVGAYNADAPLSNGGAAYVFVRNGTSWTQQQKLTASDGTASDEFGNAVGITGDIIFAGAHFADLPSNSEAGSVYIFRRIGTAWTQTQKLIPTAAVVLGDHFGESIAVSGSRIAVGAAGDDTPETAAGAVYVFAESGGSYIQQQKLTIPDGTNGDNFGGAVAIEGNTLVGGARQDTPIVGQPAYGAAYVYEFNGTTWISQGKLVASDGAAFDRFGWSVAVSNNVVAIGAREDDTAAGPDAGSAYVFTRNGATWTQIQKLTPTDPFNGDRFGSGIALSFGNLIVGAAEKALSSPNGQGAAYYYTARLPVLFDFDGDGLADISVYRPSEGAWYLQRTRDGFYGERFGAPADKTVPADYDGDGRTDIAVYRSGAWYLQRSTGGFYGINWGATEDIPVPADFDGDGKADIAVYRPSNGSWYIYNITTGQFTGYQFGAAEDKPVPADYDGDERADVAVFRPSDGAWYLLRSRDGFFGMYFGVGTDKPVPADYDGDGKADVAVYRPSNGSWYLQTSRDGFKGYAWGAAGDLAVPADYDGDGKTDVGVYRSSEGAWYLLRSGTAGFQSALFGTPTDKPIPNSFIP